MITDLPKSKPYVFFGNFDESRVFDIFCWGVTVTGVSKISNMIRIMFHLPLGMDFRVDLQPQTYSPFFLLWPRSQGFSKSVTKSDKIHLSYET